MVDQEGKKDEDKVEFGSGGEAIGYISLELARVLALRQARENTAFDTFPQTIGKDLHVPEARRG